MSDRLHVFIGTYTQRDSRGIYHFWFDLATGQASEPRLIAETQNPSFLAIHPRGRFLYACNEIGTFQGEASGALSAFALDPATGDLIYLNQQPSKGGAPCHLVVDRAGRNVLVANYTGGNIACLPIGRSGRLEPPSVVIQHQGRSVNPRRQEGPHAPSINLDAANRFAFAADLGLDQVLIYRYDSEKGSLTPNDPPFVSVAPGSGPRHFAFHPTGRWAYVINELASTITAFRYHASEGRLDPIQTISTLPPGFTGNTTTAEVQVHPSGRWVYGSNRGHDSIAIFRVDPDTGMLTAMGHQPTGGRTPRNFAVDPTGQYLLAANQATDNVTVFRIEEGALRPTGTVIRVPVPVCVKFLRPPRTSAGRAG